MSPVLRPPVSSSPVSSGNGRNWHPRRSAPGFTSGSSRHRRRRPRAPCRTGQSAQRHAGGGCSDGADVAPPRSANRASVSVVADLRCRWSTRRLLGARTGGRSMPREGRGPGPAAGGSPLLGEGTLLVTTHRQRPCPIAFCRPSTVPMAERQPGIIEPPSRRISVHRKRMAHWTRTHTQCGNSGCPGPAAQLRRAGLRPGLVEQTSRRVRRRCRCRQSPWSGAPCPACGVAARRRCRPASARRRCW